MTTHHTRWALNVFAIGVGMTVLAGANAQPFSIDWFTIDGGGGISSGGNFSVTGTIGQPDAGTMSGGNFSLVGGFWALPVAIQTEDAPTLNITPGAPGFAIISWAPNRTGFVLHETDGFSPTNWSASISAATNPVVVPATLPSKLYRLSKP